MPAQVLPVGLVIPTYDETREEIRLAYVDQFGSVDDSPDSPDGRMIDMTAEFEQSNYIAMQGLADIGDPTSAEGAGLESQCGLLGLRRKGATSTIIPVDLVGTPGMTIGANQKIVIESGALNEGEVFNIPDSFTFDGTGNVTVNAEAVNTGPIRVFANTITNILTPLPGWTSVNNTLTHADSGASLGSSQETDAELRYRRSIALSAAGAATSGAIRTKILNTDGVTSENLFINNEPFVVDGIDPFSIECVVQGGADADVAQAIFNYKSVSAGTSGNTSYSITDSEGKLVPIKFTRPTSVPIWMHVSVRAINPFHYGTKKKVRCGPTELVIGSTYTVTLNGVDYSYTAVLGDTLSSVNASLAGLVAAGSAPVIVTVIITSRMPAFFIEAIYPGNNFDCYATDNIAVLTVSLSSGDQQSIINNIVDYANGELFIGNLIGMLSVGRDISETDFIPAIMLTSNIYGVEVYQSIIPGVPTTQADINISAREIATINEYQVTVEVT
jgi:uncharacterized phage protein gp47/JayE